jgi:hypothetical protein
MSSSVSDGKIVVVVDGNPLSPLNPDPPGPALPEPRLHCSRKHDKRFAANSPPFTSASSCVGTSLLPSVDANQAEQVMSVLHASKSTPQIVVKHSIPLSGPPGKVVLSAGKVVVVVMFGLYSVDGLPSPLPSMPFQTSQNAASSSAPSLQSGGS